MNETLTREAQLSASLNRTAENPVHIHLMGICGTGMASLAGILKRAGYHVTGSDQNVYPPMSLLLEKMAIPVVMGYGPENLLPKPDLVVVGNVITRVNPEAVALADLKIPYLSFPQALKAFAFAGKKTIVVTGTHGKTTTASLAAWVLETAGLDPGFMIGGIPGNFDINFKKGKGDYFVIEGDEYDTAFFDKGPKFLHYDPWITILTSIEFDHADIYQDLEHVLSSFRKLILQMPKQGLLIANFDDPVVRPELQAAVCPVVGYGFSDRAAVRAGSISFHEGLTRVEIAKQNRAVTTLETPLYGRHNLSNLLSVVSMADHMGISMEALSQAVRSFKGVKRRQEVVGEKQDILVLDDFAHHPTAVRETIDAVKSRFKDRRVVAVFEPRSNSSRRNVFQERYAEAFDRADMIMIPEPPLMKKIPPKERFSSKRLVEDLVQQGKKAFYFPDTDQLLTAMLHESCPGDVFLIMSNGGFDNIHRRFLESL